MTIDEAKKMLKSKLECLKHETSGTDYACNQHLCEGCSLNYEQGNMGEQKEALDMAIKALEQTRWIPVSERLPKEYGEYICTMSNGDIQECGFVPSGEKKLILGWSTCEADGFKKLDYQDVTAWMPLPQPYKEVQDER